MSSHSVHDDHRRSSFSGSTRYGDGGGEEADSDDRKALTLARPVNSSLFVRNVADRATNDDIRSLFRQFGPLFDVYIPRDFHSKRPRGFAYVQFECAEDAAEAQDKLHHSNLFGRSLEVDFAKGDRKTPYEMKAQELEDPDAAFGRPSRHRHHGDHHHHRHGDQHNDHRRDHCHEHRHSSRSHRHLHHRSRSGEKRHRHRDHRHGSGDRNHREHSHRSGDRNHREHRHRQRHHSHSDHDRHNHTVKRSRSGMTKKRSQSRERGTADVQATDRSRPVSPSGRRRERSRSSSSGSASTDRSASPTPPSTPRSSPNPSRDLDSPSGLPVSDAPLGGVGIGAINASCDEEPYHRLSSVSGNDVQCNWSDEPAPPGES